MAFVTDVAQRLVQQIGVPSEDVITDDARPVVNALSTPLDAGGEDQGDHRYLKLGRYVEEFRTLIAAEVRGVNHGGDSVPEALAEHVN
ncbi:hypothetical protein [Alloactinosynnema sp. L-07]|nr:hypothetical protein [Alloactinosynnema sp. L-07]